MIDGGAHNHTLVVGAKTYITAAVPSYRKWFYVSGASYANIRFTFGFHGCYTGTGMSGGLVEQLTFQNF